LTGKKNEESENCNNQVVAIFGGQFKEKCQNRGVIGHKAKDCKSKFNRHGNQNCGNRNNFQKNMSNGTYCTYFHQPGHAVVSN
jgi:hypothetical protein